MLRAGKTPYRKGLDSLVQDNGAGSRQNFFSDSFRFAMVSMKKRICRMDVAIAGVFW
jgi:hypothetical protein